MAIFGQVATLMSTKQTWIWKSMQVYHVATQLPVNTKSLQVYHVCYQSQGHDALDWYKLCLGLKVVSGGHDGHLYGHQTDLKYENQCKFAMWGITLKDLTALIDISYV